MKPDNNLLNLPNDATAPAPFALLWLVPHEGIAPAQARFLIPNAQTIMKHIVSESSYGPAKDLRKIGMPLEIYCLFESLNEKPYKKIPAKTRRALYYNHSSWPKLKKAIKSLLNIHDLPITPDLADSIKRVDRLAKAHETSAPCLTLSCPKGDYSETKFFDSAQDIVNFVLKADFAHAGLILTDSALAKFIKNKGDVAFKKIKNSEQREQLFKEISDRVYGNRWILPETRKFLAADKSNEA